MRSFTLLENTSPGKTTVASKKNAKAAFFWYFVCACIAVRAFL